MLKITINNEEVVCDKQLEIKEEMLSTSSCILNNCYPKSWENTKDYTSQYYYPKDYSKCVIYDEVNVPAEEGEYATGTNLNINVNNTKEWSYQLEGDTQQNTSILPSGYTQVDYIQSSGTQYIDTGHYPSSNNDELEIQASYVGGNTTSCLFGAFADGSYYQLNKTTTANQFRLITRIGDVFYTFEDYSSKHKYLLDGNVLYIDGTETITGSGTVNFGSQTLYLFARNYNGTAGQFGSWRLYSCKIRTNGSLVCYFIPCYRNSDNAVGLYDLVNNVFHANQGTGAFIYGSVVDIPNPDYPQNIEVVTGEQNIIISQNGNTQNYPINLGNIELCKIGDYQDYIYKSNGNWYLHKEIKKAILDENIHWSLNSTDGYRFLTTFLVPQIKPLTLLYCDKFKGSTSNSQLFVSGYVVNPASGSISFCESDITTLSDWKTWVSNNNLLVYYILATATDTQITDTTLIQQLDNLKNATLFNGVNNISVEGNLPSILYLHYNFVTARTDIKLLFSGVVKNTGNINLNPRYPHYCSLEVLDFKTFLSECDQLDFVINNKTVSEAIEQVTQAVSSYGFVVGNININDDTIIGAYSTQEKTPYDVFQYLADISQSRWYTRLVDENTVAIDFYDPTAMQRGVDLDFYDNTFACENNVEDLSFNYGTYDYRNKQIMLSNQVFGGVDFEETIVADGYNKIFNTTTPIGILKGITVNGSSSTFATNEDKEMGVEADFYYTPGQTQIESNENDGTYPANTIIVVGYTPLVKGRQVISNTTEINRIATQTGRNGTISRYEKRNDVLSSNELELIGNSYLKYKGTPEINLTVVTKDVDLYNIGQIVYFNYPDIEDLSKDYMVKSKRTKIINTATDWNIWYTYTLTSNFNSENAINYFDNQRAKASGNIKAGDYITRNVDIENSCMIIFSNPTATEITIADNNILNAPLNAPFTQ